MLARIFLTVPGVVPCFRAVGRTSAPSRSSCAIAWRISSGNRLGQPLYIRRRFRLRSNAFSPCVPRNKCSGRTQAGLSHSWQTIMPSGISRPDNLNATRWDCSIRFLPFVPTANVPYPSRSLPPIHSQQPSLLATLLQNRSIVFSAARWPRFAGAWCDNLPAGGPIAIP